jgi:hypothetical protein
MQLVELIKHLFSDMELLQKLQFADTLTSFIVRWLYFRNKRRCEWFKMELIILLGGHGKQMVLEYQILTEVLHQQYQLILQAGFSIVSYTGTGANATVGHGLGVAPSMVICKSRTTAEGWGCYHKSLGATKLIYLNETSVPSTLSTYWQDTAPSSTVVTLGSNHAPNEIGTMIMYCFAEKKGFSKFGSYTGNGSTDGTFVYTGFKPAWLLVKRTDSARSWKLLDNKRDAYNDGTGANLNVDESGTEDDNASYAVDFLSNGFKIRNANSNFNISSGSYIYMAFAENPLVGTNNIPTTAR